MNTIYSLFYKSGAERVILTDDDNDKILGLLRLNVEKNLNFTANAVVQVIFTSSCYRCISTRENHFF